MYIGSRRSVIIAFPPDPRPRVLAPCRPAEKSGMAFHGGIVYNSAMNIKLTLGAAVAACLFAACGGTKSVGYVGASSGGKPGALHIVEVDNETGAVAVKGALPASDTTYIAVNKAKTRLYTSCSGAEFGGKGANGGVAVYELDAAGMPGKRLDAVATTRGAPCHLSISPDETRLVFAEYGKGTAGWVSLKPDGTFVKESLGVVESTDAVGPNGKRQERPHCHCAKTTPDGKYTYLVHMIGRNWLPVTQVDRGWCHNAAMSVFDAKSGKYLNTVLLDDIDLGAAEPWDVVCDEKEIVVAHSGSSELSYIDRKAFEAKLEKEMGRDLSIDMSFMAGVRRRVRTAKQGPRKLKFADGKDIFWCDFRDQFMTPDGRLPREVYPDLLHPATFGYEIWASAILPYVKGEK